MCSNYFRTVMIMINLCIIFRVYMKNIVSKAAVYFSTNNQKAVTMKEGVFTLRIPLFCLLFLGCCRCYTTCDSVLLDTICIFEVTCFGSATLPNYDLYNNVGHCSKTVYNSHNGQYYLPITLIYKLKGDFENAVPQGNDIELLEKTVTILNLSKNELNFQPSIIKMYNLEKLNFSHNNIYNAKFFNDDELENLKEVDFSYNVISTLQVSESEYVYLFKQLNKINLSHNKITNIPHLFFNNFNDLQNLDLSFNIISNVTKDTFEGISKLKYLNLSFNKIIDIDTSLFRFTQLNELNLSNNQISNIITKNFDKLNQLNVLDLSNNIISTLEDNVLDGKLLLTTIYIKYNRLQALSRNLFLAADNLKIIDVSYNNIVYLPKNMFLRKNITLFSIKGNNLTGSLERGLFEGLDSIPVLDISHQSITSVKDYSFFGLSKLTHLLLNNNFITFLSTNSFLTLKNLQRLDLSDNKIIKIDFVKSDLISLTYLAVANNLVEQIHEDDFFYLHKLQHLDLSQNNISRVQPKSFQSLISLDNFLFTKNPLVGSLEENTFDGLFSIPFLDLSGTSLTLIKNNSFDGMVHMYNLNISHSYITELQYNSFLNTHNIETIDLSYNKLSYFSVNRTHLKSLKDLRLNNNIIKKLSQDFVNGILHLNKIILSHNALSMLQDYTFQDQKYLNYLDLSYNPNLNINFSVIKYAQKMDTLILSGSANNISFAESQEVSLTNLGISNCNIRNVSYINLQKVKDIKVLLLNNNNITNIEFGAFSHLDYIQVIDISFNGIKFIEPGVFNDCHQLYTLNISHNYLSELKYGIFRGLAHLNILDISHNLLTDLEIYRFDELPNLSELVVDYNKISEISLEDFRGTVLRKISIGDNPLPCDSLIELIKYSVPKLVVTSIRYVAAKDESYKGIGCNYNKHIPYQYPPKQTGYIKQNESISEQILIDIRDILFNISKKNIENNAKTIISDNYDYEKSTKSLTEKISSLNNITSLVEKESKNINQYLERLLKLVTAINSFRTESNSQTHLKNESNKDLYKLREEIENSIVIEKEKILAEVNEKLLTINERIDALISTTEHTPINEKLALSNESRSYVFIEICVVLILFILVCFILYKMYKYRCYILNRWSVSTRHISDMENSNL